MYPARSVFCLIGWCVVFTAIGARAAEPAKVGDEVAQVRATAFENGWGTYSGGPRGKDGRIDRAELLRQLGEQHARAYSWLIWRSPHDWEDLQAFLPEARKQNLRVWVTLVPPSESPPKTRNYSEPFRLDYERWAKEIAQLSVREPALVGWSIDDFVLNAKEFPPARVRAMVEGSRAINPRLAFFPCCYFARTTAAYATQYREWFDGIFFPYRSESTKANLQDTSHVADEVRVLRERLGPGKAVVLMVYATAHSRLGATTNGYVEEVMKAGRTAADGVIVYVHQDPVRDAEKYATITRLFTAWSNEAAAR